MLCVMCMSNQRSVVTFRYSTAQRPCRFCAVHHRRQRLSSLCARTPIGVGAIGAAGVAAAVGCGRRRGAHPGAAQLGVRARLLAADLSRSQQKVTSSGIRARHERTTALP